MHLAKEKKQETPSKKRFIPDIAKELPACRGNCNPRGITAPFNNMPTLKFKAQPTNAFFATVNQMFAGSSQLSTAAERAVIKSLCRVQTTNRVRQFS